LQAVARSCFQNGGATRANVFLHLGIDTLNAALAAVDHGLQSPLMVLEVTVLGSLRFDPTLLLPESGE
jgi:hypothetical protein